MPEWECTVCGYIHEGEDPPDKCPDCAASSESFEYFLGEDEGFEEEEFEDWEDEFEEEHELDDEEEEDEEEPPRPPSKRR
jgi:rubredoxin